MFITTAAISCQQMGLYPYGGYICTMAAAFRKVPVTIDNMGSVDWNKEMTVDDAIYQEYQNAYIKKNGTPSCRSGKYLQTISAKCKTIMQSLFSLRPLFPVNKTHYHSSTVF